MFIKFRTILQGAGIIPVLLMSTVAVGQGTISPETGATVAESAVSDTGATQGNYYYDMNWYRTIKLGTAPFFNPELAKRAKVAYSFDDETISALNAWDRAELLYTSGKLVPAGVVEDGSYWVPAWSSSDKQSLEDAARTLETQGYDIVYLGQDEEFPGASGEVAGNAVVSWEGRGIVSKAKGGD